MQIELMFRNLDYSTRHPGSSEAAIWDLYLRLGVWILLLRHPGAGWGLFYFLGIIIGIN